MSCLLNELKKIEHFVSDEFSRFEDYIKKLFHHSKNDDKSTAIDELIETETFFKDVTASAKARNHAEVVEFMRLVSGELTEQLKVITNAFENIRDDADEYIKSQGQTS